MLISLDKRVDCPSGSEYYACSSNGFVGCCSEDACNLSGCPDSSTSSTPIHTSQTNQGPSSPSSTARTSSGQATTSPVETISSINDGHTVYVTISKESMPTATAQTGTEQAKGGNTPVGAIAGGVVGALALASLALVALWFIRRKKLAMQHRRATLPPPYTEPDMSAQLGGGATTRSNREETAAHTAIDEKSGLEDVPEPDPDPVPQLDSAMIRPTTEMGGDPLGNIPELADHALDAPNAPSTLESPETQPKRTDAAGATGDHVMSWAEINSLGNRHPASRLSRPHGAPDSVTLWGNLSPTIPKDSVE